MALIDTLKKSWSVNELRSVELAPTGKKIFVKPLSLRQRSILEATSRGDDPETIANARLNFLIQISFKDRKGTPAFAETEELLKKIQGQAVNDLLTWVEGLIDLPSEHGVFVVNGWEEVEPFQYPLELGNETIELWLTPPNYLDQVTVGLKTRNGMDYRESLTYLLAQNASQTKGGPQCFSKNDAAELYRLDASKIQPLLLTLWNQTGSDRPRPKRKREQTIDES